MAKKQLPCRICGQLVTIPPKYAQSKGAVCSNCSPINHKKTNV